MKTAPKPSWLKKRIRAGKSYTKVVDLLKHCRLHTVCEAALCPNLGECFSQGTATFMILGDHCTRNCRFCAVHHGSPQPPDETEPENVAQAVKALSLRYVVITSVTRDDLPNGGAGHFARTLEAVQNKNPESRTEVLIPDFKGEKSALLEVLHAKPSVLNHNLETVQRLYDEVRPEAAYDRSLELLYRVSQIDSKIPSKSGLMLGLGETEAELLQALKDLRQVHCRLLTLGQYLSPSKKHHPVIRYVPPEEFAHWEKIAYEMGFQAVAAGPFVRSSFHAGDMFEAIEKKV